MPTKTHIAQTYPGGVTKALDNGTPLKFLCGEEKVPLGEHFDPTLPFCLPCIHIHNDSLERPTWTYTIYKS